MKKIDVNALLILIMAITAVGISWYMLQASKMRIVVGPKLLVPEMRDGRYVEDYEGYELLRLSYKPDDTVIYYNKKYGFSITAGCAGCVIPEGYIDLASNSKLMAADPAMRFYSSEQPDMSTSTAANLRTSIYVGEFTYVNGDASTTPVRIKDLPSFVLADKNVFYIKGFKNLFQNSGSLYYENDYIEIDESTFLLIQRDAGEKINIKNGKVSTRLSESLDLIAQSISFDN